MKQAAKSVKSYEYLYERLNCPDCKDWIQGKLESSKREYYTERFSYQVSITLIIFSIIGILGLLLVYFNRGI